MSPKVDSNLSPLPLWTEIIYKKETGEDFLGIQSVQNNIVGYLLPGIITTTTRARYYAFYSWLISEYGKEHPKGWSLGRFIKRREQAFVIANLLYHGSLERTDRVAGLLGSNELAVHVQDYTDKTSIPYFVRKNGKDYLQAAEGGYSIYAGVMNALAITRQPEDDPHKLDLLPKGEELAKAFAKSIQETQYFKNRTYYDQVNKIPKRILLEYGEKCYLNDLDKSSDCLPVLDALFSLESPSPLSDPAVEPSPRSNMRGTLGIILDMVMQTDQPIGEKEFRRAIMYGVCKDYKPYKPALVLKPFLVHWKMFQMREYYIYALYYLWEYFLFWLHEAGPASLNSFWNHLNKDIDLNILLKPVHPPLKRISSPSDVSLKEYLDQLFTVNGIASTTLDERCAEFAQCSQMTLSENAVFEILENARNNQASLHVGAAWMLLVNFYIRLRGQYLHDQDRSKEWYWAQFGGVRRRSPKLYFDQMTTALEAGDSVLDTWQWLFRDYIIAQHTLTSLEKWRYRQVNTFHFNYTEGIFEHVRDDRPSFSASRFNRAYDMLSDLGLIEENEQGEQSLSSMGEQILKNVLGSFHG